MRGIVETDAKGIVTYYHNGDGYGFITTSDLPDDAPPDEDVFFHISDIGHHSASRGQQFQFSIIETEEGYRAKGLTHIGRREKSKKYKSNHSPGVTDDLTEADKRPKRSLRTSKTKIEDDEDDDENNEDPFSDDIRGSKNDLL